MESLARTANRGSVSTGYEIDNSLKLEDDNTEGMAKNFSGDGNQKTWTYSTWVKRTEITGSDAFHLFGGSYTNIQFMTNDLLRVELYDGASTVYADLNRVFRDTSAWYHIVVTLDTTQSTAADRVKIYINGVQDTDFNNSTYTTKAQNTNFQIGSATADYQFGYSFIGGANDRRFCGYVAETHYVNGTALDCTSFGEFDSDTGIWIPKEYTGSHGSKGFYFKFDDSSNLGKDSSSGGVGNFTVTNLTAVDQATDTPTNNGCTLNVLASLEGSNDITEGALVSTGASGSFNGTYGTMGIDPFNSSVDWYWEIEASSTTNGSSDDIGIGWIKESRITSGSTAYNNVYADGISRYSSQTATSAGDIWGVLLETGATPVMKLYRNDSLIHTSTHGSGGVSFDTLMFPYITVKGTGTDARLNFLNPASSFSIASGNADPNGYGNFEFDPKGGYALCTKNLAEYG